MTDLIGWILGQCGYLGVALLTLAETVFPPLPSEVIIPLAALEAQWRQVTERLRNAQEAIQTQQQAGLLTEAQARQQIVALQQQSATEMERLLPTMQQAAQAIGPDAVIRVQAWRNELDRTKLTVDEMAPLWNRIGESFGGALNGMITGAQTWRSALATALKMASDMWWLLVP